MSRPTEGPAGDLPAEKAAEAPRVRRLPDALVDQIAAGEVVERPASVVKELLENAVDAGAERIRIEVREGGAALVAVTDDGRGMTPADARLALERHATSKLRSAEDLQRLASYGFRGEALPAIASVSRLRLRSRARGAAEGVLIEVDHGRPVEERAAGGPEGTRVEVADLFSGIPARRKFLKSAATEWSHVADWLSRSALALPAVHFDVQRDDRPPRAWPAARDPRDRIAAVLSEREAESLLPAETVQGSLRLQAYVSRPDVHRATAAGIHLFVNGRPVRDRLLRHALLEVYRDWLPRGRFPTALLYLSLPSEAVDVNVHPAKWEVRFADPRGVHHAVAAAVREAVARRGWLASPGPVEAVRDAAADYRSGPAPRSGSSPDAAAPADWVFARGPAASPESAAPLPGLTAAPLPEGEGFRFADLRCIGQLLGTYLLVEEKRQLLLVDQHAAHERVLYERLRAGWREGGVERQALLLPATVELDPRGLAVLGERGEELASLGFEVEPFGEATAVVRAVPALLADHDPAGLVRNLAEELARDGDAGPTAEDTAAVRRLAAADRLFATLACHSARRAGDVLEAREQRALLDALDSVPWAPTCPHGRPIAVPVSLGEIERRFGR